MKFKLLNRVGLIASLGLMILLFQNCSEVGFNSAEEAALGPMDIDGNYTKYQSLRLQKHSENYVVNYSDNIINVNFQVIRSDNMQVDYESLQFFENGQLIDAFNLLNADVDDENRPVDIVFVIDITGSMEDEIQGVKNNVANFVDGFALQGIDSRLCLVTYRDNPVDRCTSFVNDDPTTEETNENLVSFKEQLSGLTASGGGDATEDTLGGVHSAATETPWADLSQRLVVIIGDQPEFWHAGDLGESNEGSNTPAPAYSATLNELTTRGIQVFTVTARGEGLDSDFSDGGNTYPSLADATKGNFYRFTDNPNFNPIFDSIVEQVATNITLSYSVQDNNLNPMLSLAERIFTVTSTASLPPDVTYEASILSFLASDPQGIDSPPMVALTHEPDVESIEVWVENYSWETGHTYAHGQLQLLDFPPNESEVRVQYLPADLRSSLRYEVVDLGPTWVNIELASLNGRILNKEGYVVEYTDSGRAKFSVKAEALKDNELNDLKEGQDLAVEIKFRLMDEAEIEDKMMISAK